MPQTGLSTLEVNTERLSFELRILSSHNKRERRELLLSFFRQIKPWLRSMREEQCRIFVNHNGDGVRRSKHAEVLSSKLRNECPQQSVIGSELRIACSQSTWEYHAAT